MKKDPLIKKSKTCYGKKSKKPLTVYDTKVQAQLGAEHANKKYKNNLTPYQCNKCGLWHLTPIERQTPSKKCKYCIGQDNKPKDAYPTKSVAQRRANILLKENGVKLTVYKCERGNGWHLTKKTHHY